MCRQCMVIMSRNTVKGSQGGTVCRRKTNWCRNFSVCGCAAEITYRYRTVGFIMQKNAPLQSNFHENAFNPHLKLNESLACRTTHSYIVQEEGDEGKTPHGGKINLVYFYGCWGAAFFSQHISLQRGDGGTPSSNISKLETAEPNPRRLGVNWRDKKPPLKWPHGSVPPADLRELISCQT